MVKQGLYETIKSAITSVIFICGKIQFITSWHGRVCFCPLLRNIEIHKLPQISMP